MKIPGNRIRVSSLLKTALLLALIPIAAGCKPTEKNYKAAYDAALKKREAAAVDADMMIPAGALQQIGGPQKRKIGDVEVYMLVEPIRQIADSGVAMRRYNVAVASYKMQTNSSAQVADLVSQGYNAFEAENGDQKFYVISAAFDTPEDAAAFISQYKVKSPDASYVGLPDAPVIIESR